MKKQLLKRILYCGLAMMAFSNLTKAQTTSQTNVSCYGSSDGSATVTPSGIPPFNFLWNTGDTTSTITGLTAGTYTCTVSDAFIGYGIHVFHIAEPAALTATTSQTNVSCHRGFDGIASVSVSGGTPPYTYIWDESNSTDSVATALSAGNYNCTITDANLCAISRKITITEPNALTANVYHENIRCHGGNDGVAAISAEGGTGSYTYVWDQNASTHAVAWGLAAGQHTCQITDANSCTISKTFTITEPDAIVNSFSAVICQGESFQVGNSDYYDVEGLHIKVLQTPTGCDSTVMLNLSVIPKTYFTLNETACSEYTFLGRRLTQTGTYQDVVSNSAGCDSIITLNLTVTHVSNTIVKTETDSLVAEVQAGATYQWINCADNSPIAGATETTFMPEQSGDYAVVITNGLCIEASNCINVNRMITGVVPMGQNMDVTVYPNPVTDVLHLRFSQSVPFRTELYNAQGKLVVSRNESGNNAVIDMNEFATGIYMLRVSTDDTSVTKQVVLVK